MEGERGGGGNKGLMGDEAMKMVVRVWRKNWAESKSDSVEKRLLDETDEYIHPALKLWSQHHFFFLQ